MQDNTLIQPTPKLLKAKEVADLCRMSVTNIYTLERQGKFPKRRKLTENSTVWLESEVNHWIMQRLGLVSKTNSNRAGV